MYQREPVDFMVIERGQQPGTIAEICVLLEENQLGIDDDIEYFVTARVGKTLVGCAGLAGSTIKCVAVAPVWRGENLSARLISEVEHVALEQGHFHLFLYTRPANLQRFRASGFYPLVQWNDVAVLMENTPVGIQRYCQSLQRLRQPGNCIGSIVMNANPFTLGHRYLVEQAAHASDWLHLFVVREDVSFFPFSERLDMVQQGVAHLNNVTVHAGSEYLISRGTFPGYFLKESGLINQTWSAMDLLIFRKYIVPALGITRRFVGTEPFCPVTRQYNCDMHQLLESHQGSSRSTIEVVELPRICNDGGNAISASEVRALLKIGQLTRIREIVPESTFRHLQMRYATKVA